MKNSFQHPYYAVIFKSKRTNGDNGYTDMADQTMQLVEKQSGFLGVDSVRGGDGVGITVSYWDSLESIEKWKHHALHMQAKENGKSKWYSEYTIKICRIEPKID